MFKHKIRSLLSVRLFWLGVFFMGAASIALSPSASHAVDEKEHQSTEYLIQSCKEALNNTSNFHASFCSAYLAGYLGAKASTLFKIGSETLNKGIELETPQDVECQNFKKINDQDLLYTARYLVNWLNKHKRLIGEDGFQSEAHWVLEMVFFDKRYCNLTVKTGD